MTRRIKILGGLAGSIAVATGLYLYAPKSVPQTQMAIQIQMPEEQLIWALQNAWRTDKEWRIKRTADDGTVLWDTLRLTSPVINIPRSYIWDTWGLDTELSVETPAFEDSIVAFPFPIAFDRRKGTERVPKVEVLSVNLQTGARTVKTVPLSQVWRGARPDSTERLWHVAKRKAELRKEFKPEHPKKRRRKKREG